MDRTRQSISECGGCVNACTAAEHTAAQNKCEQRARILFAKVRLGAARSRSHLKRAPKTEARRYRNVSVSKRLPVAEELGNRICGGLIRAQDNETIGGMS